MYHTKRHRSCGGTLKIHSIRYGKPASCPGSTVQLPLKHAHCASQHQLDWTVQSRPGAWLLGIADPAAATQHRRTPSQRLHWILGRLCHLPKFGGNRCGLIRPDQRGATGHWLHPPPPPPRLEASQLCCLMPQPRVAPPPARAWALPAVRRHRRRPPVARRPLRRPPRRARRGQIPCLHDRCCRDDESNSFSGLS